MLRKVINLKEGLKLTCGAGCPVDRGVGGQSLYAARTVGRRGAESADVEEGEQ